MGTDSSRPNFAGSTHSTHSILNADDMALGRGGKAVIGIIILLLLAVIVVAALVQAKVITSGTTSTQATNATNATTLSSTPAAWTAASPTPSPVPPTSPSPSAAPISSAAGAAAAPVASPTPAPLFTTTGFADTLNWLSTSTTQSIPRYLDCDKGVCTAGDKLQVWHGTGAAGQKWALSTTGVLSSGGLCLDASSNPVAPAACNASAAQTWGWQSDAATGLSQLRNQGTGTCLDVAGGVDADGTPLQMFDCAGSWTRWRTGSPIFQLQKNPGAVLSICISPIDGKMYAAGTDHNVYQRARNSTSWTAIANPCCVTAVEFCGGQQLNGIGSGGSTGTVYYKTTADIASAWVQSGNATKLLDIAWNALTNVQWGIGVDNRLYYNDAGGWKLQGTGVTGLVAISIATDGRQWFVATDGSLYYQTVANGALNTSADCTRVPNTKALISLACDRFSNVIYIVSSNNTVSVAPIRQSLAAYP